MHFVRVQRRLNRVTGIEVFIWLMSYELQGCHLLKTPKMELSSDPLKVRETGNDFWMKIRRDEPIYLPRSLRGLQQEMPQSRIFMLLENLPTVTLAKSLSVTCWRPSSSGEALQCDGLSWDSRM